MPRCHREFQICKSVDIHDRFTLLVTLLVFVVPPILIMYMWGWFPSLFALIAVPAFGFVISLTLLHASLSALYRIRNVRINAGGIELRTFLTMARLRWDDFVIEPADPQPGISRIMLKSRDGERFAIGNDIKDFQQLVAACVEYQSMLLSDKTAQTQAETEAVSLRTSPAVLNLPDLSKKI